MIAQKKSPRCFLPNQQGTEPVRDFIRGLAREDKRIIGADISTVEFGCPVGSRHAHHLERDCGKSVVDLTSRRIARLLFMLHQSHMMLLHGFIKKTQKTPRSDLDIARKRMKEISR